jgi:hypothetical protein
MPLNLTPEQMAGYRAGARRRAQQRAQALAARAWDVARRGAQMLVVIEQEGVAL